MKKNKKQKLALVLSGGGFNCAFQLGALNYINKNWKKITGLSGNMKFDIVAGVSGGALNGAFIAMNELPLLNELWINQIGKKGVSEIYTSDFIDTSNNGNQLKLKINYEKLAKRLIPNIEAKIGLFNKLGIIFSKQKRKQFLDSILKEMERNIKLSLPQFRSIADNSPLRQKLHKYLNRNRIKDTQFVSGFVSLNSGEYHSVIHHQYKSNEDFINGVLASTAMPLIWQPVSNIRFATKKEQITSKNNVDGGIRNVSPLGDVIKLINEDRENSYKIIVINTNSGTPKPKDYSNKSVFGITLRSLYEITLTEVFNNDVNHFLKINELIKQSKAWDYEISLFNQKNQLINSFEAVLINPEKKFDLGNPLVANEKLIKLRMEHGEKMTHQTFRINL